MQALVMNPQDVLLLTLLPNMASSEPRPSPNWITTCKELTSFVFSIHKRRVEQFEGFAVLNKSLVSPTYR